LQVLLPYQFSVFVLLPKVTMHNCTYIETPAPRQSLYALPRYTLSRSLLLTLMLLRARALSLSESRSLSLTFYFTLSLCLSAAPCLSHCEIKCSLSLFLSFLSFFLSHSSTVSVLSVFPFFLLHRLLLRLSQSHTHAMYQSMSRPRVY